MTRTGSITAFLFLLICFCTDSCSSTKQIDSEKAFIVNHEIDLKGGTLLLPINGTMVIKEGGCIKNGTIVGRNTQIKSTTTSFFNNIHIDGEWIVPNITCDFFSNINDDDILKEVFALSSAKVHNTIVLGKRDFWVTATATNKNALTLKSNTNLFNDGTIRIRANGLTSYSIISTSGNNIRIKGGNYVGERKLHLETTGEWGHGIRITNGSSNISISDVNVHDCWGDGIAIDGNEINTNIRINSFAIDNCRRQGISVIYANDCLISNGIITNIQGTEPHLGIDIEPNANGYCHNITIDNVTIESEKGLGIFTATKDFQVKNVTIKNCKINTTGYSSIYAARCDGLTIKENSLICSASGNNPIIAINTGVKNSQLLFNKICYTGDDKSYCCVYNAGENTLIKKNTIKGTLGVAFYTRGAIISENEIAVPEFMTYANNATGNNILTNKINGNLSCAASNNTFRNNNINGSVKLNGGNCTFANNEVQGKTVSGTPSNGQFINNKVIVEELFEFNGHVSIKSNNIQSPKVMLKTGTTTSNNTFVQTKDNNTDSFIRLYGNIFEDNIIRTKSPKGSHTVTYIYCTSEGTTIRNNEFGAAPAIKYWLYSTKNLKLSNNRPAQKQHYQTGTTTVTD